MNPALVRIRFSQAMKAIKGYKSSLRYNKQLLQDNLETFNDFLNRLRNYEHMISLYILAGRIRLKQVDALLAEYGSGDRSRIKNDEIEGIVKNSKREFTEKLLLLEYARVNCQQTIAAMMIEIENNKMAIKTISSIINITIPAFENENALSY